MWLLDANMDVHLVAVLTEFGIRCDTAGNRGWKALSNGDPVWRAILVTTDNCREIRFSRRNSCAVSRFARNPVRKFADLAGQEAGCGPGGPPHPDPGVRSEM